MGATHIDFAIIGRTRTGRVDGGSAVSASAYNRCARFEHASGKVFDFRRKAAEHVGGDVLLPGGAPPALRDPAALWQAAEDIERRSDAQLSRQVLVSLPRGCPPDLRLDMARAIAADWVASGMAVQVDVHNIQAEDGDEQPHAHFLLTLRRVSDAGFAATKDRSWNQRFRACEGRTERKRIADAGNAFLLAHGIIDRLEARSLAQQGAERTPEPAASRQAWQRWKRDGSDPSQAPAPIAAVLRHRQRRQALSSATALAATSAALAADIEAQLALAEQATPDLRPPEPRPAPKPERALPQHVPADPVSAAPQRASTRRAEHVITQPAQEADMARPALRPTSYRDRRPTPRIEPWMRQEGGLTALSDALRASAERSYAEWSRRKPALAERHDLRDYVSFVQDRQAHEAERERLATEAPGLPVRPRPEGVAPATDGAAHRAEHLARTLADQVPALPSSTWRAKTYPEEGVSRIWPPGSQAHIVDRGDRLEPSGPITTDLAAATVQLAADRGWKSLTLTGSADYRDAIGVAAALHRPPIQTDHVLSKQAADQLAGQLRERAMPPALDAAAVQQLAASDPAAAARQVLDHAEARARAGLAGQPTGSTVPSDIAAPRVADLVTKRDQAREDRREAAEALAAHHASYSWSSRLLDPAVRARHTAMRSESRRLTTQSLKLDGDIGKSTRKVAIAAEREAKGNRAALDDWRWSKPVRQAEASLAQLATVRTAMEAGSSRTVEALARGDLKASAAAAKAWQTSQDGPLRIASSPEESARWTRQEAIQTAHRWESANSADPVRLAQARQITGALLAGDPAAVQSVAAGDHDSAAEAAAAWQAEQARKARLAEERAQQRAATANLAQQEPAQPTM